MNNFFNHMKSYSFWVSLSAAIVILLNALGRAFGFKIENQIVEDCIMSIAGLLVVFGIVTMNDKNSNLKSEDEDISVDTNPDSPNSEDKVVENLETMEENYEINEKKSETIVVVDKDSKIVDKKETDDF